MPKNEISNGLFATVPLSLYLSIRNIGSKAKISILIADSLTVVHGLIVIALVVAKKQPDDNKTEPQSKTKESDNLTNFALVCAIAIIIKNVLLPLIFNFARLNLAIAERELTTYHTAPDLTIV